jgi:hypothetical protein
VTTCVGRRNYGATECRFNTLVVCITDGCEVRVVASASRNPRFDRLSRSRMVNASGRCADTVVAMTQLTHAELIDAVVGHPDSGKWADGVKPEHALYIAFASGQSVQSETFDAADGSLIVLDVNADGQVCGIEIT